jgi:hypothetical protein
MSAYLDTPQAVRRRRAFLAAMAPAFGQDRALEAINLWEQTFGSDQPLLRGISKFAALAVAELKLPVNAPDLTMMLLEQWQRDESRLPPDPLPQLTGRRAGTPPPGAAVAVDRAPPRTVPPTLTGTSARRTRHGACARTLGVLLLKLCDHAGQADARAQAALIRAFVTDCAARFSREIGNDLGLLLTGRAAELGMDYPPPLATQIVNALYVPLAEFYGPVSADRIVTQAVRAAQDAPEARDFEPRDLL